MCKGSIVDHFEVKEKESCVSVNWAYHTRSLAGNSSREEWPWHKHSAGFRAQDVGLGPSSSLELGAVGPMPVATTVTVPLPLHLMKTVPTNASWTSPQWISQGIGMRQAVLLFSINTPGTVKMTTPILPKTRSPPFSHLLACVLLIPGM